MSLSSNYQARPISTEYSGGQLQVAPPYSTTNPEPADAEGYTDRSNYNALYPYENNMHSSPRAATLSTSDGRETMVSPGLESVQADDTEKEAYRLGPHNVIHDQSDSKSKERRTVCGVALWLVLVLLGLLLVLAIALGVGLGVGLQHKKSSGSATGTNAGPTSSHAPTASATSSPNYYSTSGAFNGTGIALATESFGQDSYGTVVVYFQHWTGTIRQMQLSSDGSWVGGGETDIVATDARNGTPIAAVAYAMDGVSTWHIFYIDKDHTLQETINGNTSNIWTVGPLGSFGFKAMDDPNVGLQGCWAGYRPGGQINAVPIAGTGHNYSSSSQTEGINLWYGAEPTTLQSVGWLFGTSTWTKKESLTGLNAHAGIGCYSWGPGTVTYLIASDLHNTVNIWWKDLNKTATGNASHPVGVWTNTSISIPNSYQNTSLGYTDYLYSQSSDLNLVGYNVSFNAEATSFVPGDNFEIQNDFGLPGTRMTVTAVPNDSGGQALLVFNQVTGDSITEYIRDLVAGQWTSLTLPIPQQ